MGIPHFLHAIWVGAMVVTFAATRLANGALIAETGFNDAAGIHADAVPGSPYQFGATISGQGGGEPGWLDTWTVISGSVANSTVQDSITFEVDGALYIQRTTNTFRRWSQPLSGTVTIQQRLRFTENSRTIVYAYGDAFGGVFDFGSSAGPQFNVFPDGTIHVVDDGVVELTGFTWAPNTWYEFVTISDVPNQIWRFFMNGVEHVGPDPLDFRGSPLHLDGLNYLAEVSGNGTYVDAIRIFDTVPEPASAVHFLWMTLAVVGTAFVRRKAESKLANG